MDDTTLKTDVMVGMDSRAGDNGALSEEESSANAVQKRKQWKNRGRAGTLSRSNSSPELGDSTTATTTGSKKAPPSARRQLLRSVLWGQESRGMKILRGVVWDRLRRTENKAGRRKGEGFQRDSFDEFVLKEIDELKQAHQGRDVPRKSLRKAWNKFSFTCVQIDNEGVLTRRSVTREGILEIAREFDLYESVPARRRTRAANRIESARGHIVVRRKKTHASRYTELSKRDIRQVDPTFSPKPALWVRRNALVVSLDSIRALIFRDKVLIFDVDKEGMSGIIDVVKEKIKEDPRSRGNFYAPFEFRALEGILITVQTRLEKTFYTKIVPDLESVQGIPHSPTLEFLEDISNRELLLIQYTIRVSKVAGMLQDLLHDDEDMAEMYLTEKYKNPDVRRNILDHDEAEMLLEHYLQGVEFVWSKAQMCKNTCAEAKGHMSIHLDQGQNQILMLDLMILIITASFNGGTLIANILGMNLAFPRSMGSGDRNPAAFYWVVGASCLFIFGLMAGGFWYCRREGLLTGAIFNGGLFGRASDDLYNEGEQDFREAFTLTLPDLETGALPIGLELNRQGSRRSNRRGKGTPRRRNR